MARPAPPCVAMVLTCLAGAPSALSPGRLALNNRRTNRYEWIIYFVVFIAAIAGVTYGALGPFVPDVKAISYDCRNVSGPPLLRVETFRGPSSWPGVYRLYFKPLTADPIK